MDTQSELKSYLQNISENLRLDPNSEKEILREIEAHVEDSCAEMKNEGLTESEALERSLKLLGPARALARQIYETHSQGTWRQALLAAMPHLFFAILFTLNWLTGIAWISVLLLFIAIIALYGLLHGKPGWLFPWLGYSLFPVVIAGLALLYLPTGWSWVTLALYVPLCLWLICVITIKFIRRDWVYASLMLLPVPTIVGWFMASHDKTNMAETTTTFLHRYAPWAAVTFLLLGLAVTVFLRMKKRWLRVTSLCITAMGTAAIISLVSNHLGVASLLGLSVLMVCLLLVPAYVERRLSKSSHIFLNTTSSGR